MLAPFGAPLGTGHDSVVWLAKTPGGKRKMPRIENVQRLKMGLDFKGKGRKFNGFSCMSLSPLPMASNN